eukprot:gene7838-50067_t
MAAPAPAVAGGAASRNPRGGVERELAHLARKHNTHYHVFARKQKPRKPQQRPQPAAVDARPPAEGGSPGVAGERAPARGIALAMPAPGPAQLLQPNGQPTPVVTPAPSATPTVTQAGPGGIEVRAAAGDGLAFRVNMDGIQRAPPGVQTPSCVPESASKKHRHKHLHMGTAPDVG